MRKLILALVFLFIGITGNTQTIDYSTRQILEREDSRNKLWLPYDYYQNDFDLDSLKGNNYFFWSNAIMIGDTLNHVVWVRKHHGDPKNGFMAHTKVVKGIDTARSYYETKVTEGGSDIPILNRSLAYSDIDQTGDTLVGVQHDPFFNQDTIVFVNRNMGSLKKVYFDKSSLGFTRLWNMSPIINAYGKWWLVGYQPLTAVSYTTYILSSPNRGLSWNIVDSVLPVLNRFRPEEPAITLAANGDLLVFSRSDIGNFTWISRSIDSGQSWLPPVRAFKGGNHPLAITTSSGAIVVAPSRHIAQNSQGQPLKEMNDTFFYDNILLQNGYTYYTNIQISWDNGSTWHEFIVDKERAERQWCLPDGASVVELPNGKVRIFWSTGFGGLNGVSDVADHRYADLEIGDIEGSIRFVGGTSVLSYQMSDPQTGRHVNLKVDSNELKITGTGVDRYVFDKNVFIGNTDLGEDETDIYEGNLNITGAKSSLTFNRFGSTSFVNFRAFGGTPQAPTDFPLNGSAIDNGGMSYLMRKNGMDRLHARINFNAFNYNGNHPVTNFEIRQDTGTGLLSSLVVDTSLVTSVKGGLIVDNGKNAVVNGGKFGIGTLYPVYDFDFNSDGSGRWNNFQNMRGMFFQNGIGTFIGRIMRNDLYGMQYTSFDGFGWSVNDGTGVSNTAEMFLSNQGKLGIGTVNPANHLDVNGKVSIRSIDVSNSFNDTALYINASNEIVKRATSPYQLTGSGILDFPTTAGQTSEELTISVTGAEVGDVVSIGYLPNRNDVCFTAYVSSSGFVTIRFNNYSGSSVNPSNMNFNVVVNKF